ncbi:unnamed protein product, partial [Choristocarpus tenellus]
METVKVLRGFHERAVSLLAFSDDGVFLASVGQDEQRCLGVYDWENGSLHITGSSTTKRVLGCCFGSDGCVVTCGEGHVFFWKQEGRFLCKRKGVFGQK